MYVPTLNDIIEGALLKLRVISHHQSPNPNQYERAKKAMNTILHSLENDTDIRLWKEEYRTKTFTPDDFSGCTIGDQVFLCIKTHTEDIEPLVHEDWADYWVEYTGYSDYTFPAYSAPTGTRRAVGEALLDSDVLDVKACFLRESPYDYATNTQEPYDYPLQMMKFSDLIEGKDLLQFGYRPNSIAVIKTEPVRVILNPRPTPDQRWTLHYLGVTLIDDFAELGDTPDTPQHWGRALIWMLADELALEFGLNIRERNEIERKAEKYKALVMNNVFQDTTPQYIYAIYD